MRAGACVCVRVRVRACVCDIRIQLQGVELESLIERRLNITFGPLFFSVFLVHQFFVSNVTVPLIFKI